MQIFTGKIRVGIFLSALFCVFFGTGEAFAAPGDLDFSFGIQGRRIKTVPNSQPQDGHDFFSADIVVQPDGKILIAGYAFDSNLGDSMVIARYNANGTLDSGFANGGIFRYEHGNVYSTDKLAGIALQTDGKIVAAGRVTVGNGNPAFAVIRLNPNGTFDSTFGTGGIVVKDFFSSIDEATEVAIQADGKILVSGWVTQGGVNNGLTYDFTVLRYDTSGNLDPSFGNGGVVFTDFGGRGDLAQASVLQPDGKLVVSGWVSVAGSQYDFGLARYNTDGSLDATFGAGGKVVTPIVGNLGELVRGMSLSPGGKIVVTGDLYNPSIPGGSSGHSDIVVVRYNPDGSLDTTFDADGKFVYDSNLSDRNEGGEDVTVQPDGKILVTGGSHLRQETGVSHKDMLLMRIRANGGLDSSFGSGGVTYTDFGLFAGPFTTPRSGDKGSAITLQADGKIVVAGDSHFAGDTTERPLGNFNNRLAVARFQNDITSNVVRRVKFDFDGDGRADISVFRDGVWHLLGGTSGYSAVQFGIDSDQIVPADFDADGKTDLAVFRGGTWYVLRSSNNQVLISRFGLAGDKPLPSDFDGDGLADFIVFRPSNNTWYRMSGATGATSEKVFGLAGDKPVIGDFDGDGKSDAAIYRPSTGDWWWQSSIDNSQRAVRWGISTDVPVAADYDADGKTDFAVYRGGNWYILQSSGGNLFTQFGLAKDTPTAADFDGDGKADIAVYRNGIWHQLRSQQGYQATQFGITNDTPAPSAFIP